MIDLVPIPPGDSLEEWEILWERMLAEVQIAIAMLEKHERDKQETPLDS